MILIRKYFFIILSLTSMYILHAEKLITLTFRPYPIVEEPKSAEQFANNLKKPGKIAYNTLRSFLEGGDVVSGIFCTYAGFIALSDWYGHVSFPKLQTRPKLYLLITNRIIPIILAYNTIHHWELESGTPSQLFVLEQKQDPQTELYYWDVQPSDLSSVFPNGKRIPVETIVVFAQPRYIYVPTGITIVPGIPSPHLLLPSIYVRKGLHKLENALYVLNLKYFFRKLRSLNQLYPTGYSALLDYR